jgi:hypothetical protein
VSTGKRGVLRPTERHEREHFKYGAHDEVRIFCPIVLYKYRGGKKLAHRTKSWGTQKIARQRETMTEEEQRDHRERTNGRNFDDG